eukprot:4055156-Ditylum_brightwellii.AAC.1
MFFRCKGLPWIGPRVDLHKRHILLFVLQQEEQICSHMPTQQELESFVNVIGQKYKILAKKKACCVIDCLKLYLQEADKVEVQEWFYNGWKHDHCRYDSFHANLSRYVYYA